MSINDISNGSLVFKLSGKDYSVKRLNLMDLFGEFEAEVKKQYMDDIIGLAERMTSSKERIDFQRQAIKDIPKGKELDEAVKNVMDSTAGGIKLLWLGLKKENKITIEEVRNLISLEENQATITNMMNFITGQDQEAKVSDIPEGATVIEPEKKIQA